MDDRGLLVANEQRPRRAPADLGPGRRDHRTLVSFYDATNPAAREYIWAQGPGRATTSTAYGSGGSTRASRSWCPSSQATCAITSAPGSRSATSTRMLHARASTRACAPRARTRSSRSAGPPGRAASATARRSGRATSTRPSRTCGGRSPPGSTSASGHPVVDHGHRRVQGRRHHVARVPRAHGPVVPVRRVLRRCAGCTASG